MTTESVTQPMTNEQSPEPLPAPMSPAGQQLFRQLFALGRRMADETAYRDTRRAALQRAIALCLHETDTLDRGLTFINFDLLTAPEQRRLLDLAARAQDLVDPQIRVDAAAEVVADVAAWATEQPAIPYPDDVAREAISRYEATLSQPAVVLSPLSPAAARAMDLDPSIPAAAPDGGR